MGGELLALSSLYETVRGKPGHVGPEDIAPVVQSQEFTSEVVAVEAVMGDSVLITSTAPAAIVNQLRAGRFFDILCRVDGSYDPLLRRPYSVLRAHPSDNTITFLVRPYGRGSSWLAAQVPGTRLNLLGPLGNTYQISPTSRHLLMVAGGVGVAPLVMLADEATRRGLRSVLLMGSADANGLLVPSYLSRDVEFVAATEDGSKGHHGFVTDLVGDYVRWADQIFACGPEPMYRSLRAAAAPLRVGRRPTVQISMERNMACGVGACLGCVVETRQGMRASCVEGPVYDLDEVLL
jgi:dihydroorotate dehydrogenase electron transfer subunit